MSGIIYLYCGKLPSHPAVVWQRAVTREGCYQPGHMEYNVISAGGGAPVAGGANSLTAAQLLGSLVSPSHRQQSNIVLQNIQECARPRYAIP